MQKTHYLLLVGLLFIGRLVCAETNPLSIAPSKANAKPKEHASQNSINLGNNRYSTNGLTSSAEAHKSNDIQEKTSHKEENRKDYFSSEWWLVYLTGSLALITGALAFYTARLYRATVNLGRDAESSSHRQAGEMKQYLNIAKQSADASIESNKISREVLIAEQRPWISVDIELAGHLSYDAKGWSAGTRWHIPIKYKLRNHGKTPGTNVSFFASIVPFITPHFPKDAATKEGIPQGSILPGTDIAKEFETICSFPEQMSNLNMGWGQVLFPEESEGKIFGLNGAPARFDVSKETLVGYTGQFIIVVCVTYGSTYSKEPYRTVKAFNLYKTIDNGTINLDGETVAVVNLRLAQHPIQGSYAQ
jgi:hypothetical protein